MKSTAIVAALLVSIGIVASTPARSRFEEIIDPGEELLRAAITTSIPPHELDDWMGWETWEAPPKIVKLAPYYKAGYDNDGLPIYVMEYGKWNYREIAALPADELEAFVKHYEQFIRRVSKAGTENNGQGIVFICDWNGFTLSHFASSGALKLSLKSFTSIVRFNDAVKYAYQLNTNFAAETFLNIARPFLGNILEKFEIYGTRSNKWKPALIRKIPQDQLPPQFGGKEDWKPLPLI